MDEKRIRNAKSNCITLFAVLVLWVLSILWDVVVLGATEPHLVGCFIYPLSTGAIYAAIYLPLRWRFILDLPQPHRSLGLIGGFGLILLLIIAIIVGLIKQLS